MEKPKVKAKLIFLCGFMGSGKSTIGKLAAKKAGIGFIDLDDEIVKTAGKSIPEIFAERGEGHFRQIESATLALVVAAAAITSDKVIIIALGGGTIVDPKNANTVNEFGKTVFIDCDFETCYNRIKNDPNRPLVKTEDELKNLYKIRRIAYQKYAKHTINGGNEIDILADEIAEIAKGES
ncbi:MAG: shikimate kinase [Oscillospiraceae bacterium]|nr:shikimate kinase [Oscillospiraceae bacterium]